MNPYTFEKTRQYESEEYGDEDRLMIRGNDEFDDTLDEGPNMTRNVTVTVKHHIPITDDMMPVNIHNKSFQNIHISIYPFAQLIDNCQSPRRTRTNNNVKLK